MGSASANGSSLNLPAANKPPLSKVSEDEDKDDNVDGSEMIIRNLFPHGPGVGGGVLVMSMGRMGRSRKAVVKMTILIFPRTMKPTACLMLK